jgi:hypothetical protein
MSLNFGNVTAAGNRVSKAAAGNVGKIVKASGGKTPPTHPAADTFPSSLLVPMQTFGQMSGQAHNAANADTQAALAGIPADSVAQQQYGTLGTNLSGISQALVDALGGTQHYQIGTANGIAQGYTNAANADQSAAQQAALALGGTAAPLSGSSGAAAAALSSPGVSAANATGGLIDAAKLRGANLQIGNDQNLAAALSNLAAQRTAETAKTPTYYNQYLTAAEKQNQQAAIANQGAGFKYADLGIRQQNANTAAAYDATRAALGGTTAANTASYDSGRLGIAQQNANTAQTKAASAGSSGTARNPATGYTPAQTTTAVQRMETGLTKSAASGLKGTKTTSKAADRYSLPYEGLPSTPGGPPILRHADLTPQQYQEYMAAPRWERAKIAGLPQGQYVPGSFQTPEPSHYATTSSVGGRSYYDTEHTLEAQIAKSVAAYHLGWTHGRITQEAQQAMVRGGWKPGQYGMPGPQASNQSSAQPPVPGHRQV